MAVRRIVFWKFESSQPSHRRIDAGLRSTGGSKLSRASSPKVLMVRSVQACYYARLVVHRDALITRQEKWPWLRTAVWTGDTRDTRPAADIYDSENSLVFDFRPGQLRAPSYRNVTFPVKLLAVEK
jgi:hypothetical protein